MVIRKGQYVRSPDNGIIYQIVAIGDRGHMIEAKNDLYGNDKVIDRKTLETWEFPTEDEIAKAVLLGELEGI
jgi:hypothetical protein